MNTSQLTPEQIAELRKVAEKATQEQWSHLNGIVYAHTEETEWELFEGNAYRHEDAVFVSAANPRAVLALLDALEARDKRIAEQEIHLEGAGEIRVGRLPTMNQDEYPGLGDWWVQLRIGDDFDEVLARVYGATPQEANNRAEALICRAAMLQSEPVSNRDELPDGWVMVPKEPTESMIVDGFESEPDEDFSEPGVWEEYQAMSGCQQAAHRAKLCWAAMIAAAPQQEVNEVIKK